MMLNVYEYALTGFNPPNGTLINPPWTLVNVVNVLIEINN